MGSPPLTGTMRIRVIIGAISAVLMVLLFLPLEILAIAHGRGLGEIAIAFGLGVGLPALFGGLMWWQVRRWRRNPEVRRRQPNKAASRVILFGNMAVILAGNVARGVSGLSGWQGWAICLGVVLVGSTGVALLAKRLDPRLHFFRRPDPLPEGQEPEEASVPPW